MQDMQEMWVQSLGQKIPWSRKWQSTPVFLPGKSQGQRSLVGYHPWGHKRAGHDFSDWTTTNLNESIWPMILAVGWRADFGRIRNNNEKPRRPPVLAPLLCCLSPQSPLPHDDRETWELNPSFQWGFDFYILPQSRAQFGACSCPFNNIWCLINKLNNPLTPFIQRIRQTN